jgi:hypothetical protein
MTGVPLKNRRPRCDRRGPIAAAIEVGAAETTVGPAVLSAA